MESATASIARLGGAPLLRLQTDERLAALAAAGEERAFEVLTRRYRGPLVRACQRMLASDQAEDAVQQALLNAHQALLRNGPPDRFRPWLHRIATNAALKLIEASPDTAPLDAEQVIGAESPETMHERRDRTKQALAAVAALPDGQRRALVARELEGRSHDEIGRELGLSGGAARQLIYRARHAVRSAASALLPLPLVARFLTPGGGEVAELAGMGASAGGAAVATKIAAITVIAGGLAGGAAVVAPLGDRDSDPVGRVTSGPDAASRGGGGSSSGGGDGDPPSTPAALGPRDEGGTAGDGHGGEGEGHRSGDDARHGDGNSGEGGGDRGREGPGDSSGPGHGGAEPAEDASSGPSPSSGGGSGGSHSGSSGSGGPGGSGSGSSNGGSSGSGSGSSQIGESGSGSSGPGGGGSSGSDGSGSGSSGSGDTVDSSGPGSADEEEPTAD